MATFLRPILAFDTSAAHCAAALVVDGGTVPRVARFEPMQKGQAERLMPLLEEMLDEAGLAWPDLGGIAVGTGPGNFTGVRIAVAAARGLALGLGIPATGLSAFALMRDPDGPAAHAAEWVSLPAPRDQAYLQAFRYGVPQAAPRVVDPAALPDDLTPPPNLRVIGHRAAEIARPCGAGAVEAALDRLPERLARLASWRFETGALGPRPAPLYVRPADAAPPADPPPVILP
ncbi:tRNA (adenosine(37)-N6)-threonylcarbamoyltransferase complex dimerization subunit type 1 TsaB [Ruixingdingia sedimenti]|uniref:tRNA (Adenosine(37)-N6)-threonylcarbamoyltransferase complex dimerization subunit type 1 TsaB n=1 Tax=Ruixingdingia sedimenti TaxID=3073604 RepID=A0ABU1FC58_9RHOB|nr:tRNA (adenosine(37)-N6)-threonylcarbamoyltransferase complex dimerization subunit type 1 TsaB [Xinfangfangia sp. LG-4]MDR5654455.1 tRNA (adenosine(37)-N6)-threonylcarbamoyltransferase complex dimerization subunit type 1 TsaB [Xinfangfangia sp. LG-4]